MQFKESEREEDEIVIVERPFLWAKSLAVQQYFDREIDETLTLFLNDFAEKDLRASMGYYPEGKDASYAE